MSSIEIRYDDDVFADHADIITYHNQFEQLRNLRIVTGIIVKRIYVAVTATDKQSYRRNEEAT